MRRPLVLLLVVLPLLLGAAPPQDPLVGQQPHLTTVHTFEAWDVRRGEGAVVAVLDTGVDLDHPDLAGRLLEGIDLVEPGTPPDDPQGHGTIVAGIIAAVANNSRGVAGVAPQAQILPVRVLDAQGRGTADVVAEGIRYAIDQQVDVINLSLAEVKPEDEEEGQGAGSGPPLLGEVSLVESEGVVRAIEEADAAGILVVAAAGNDGRSQTPYDRDTPVLVVGATDPDGYVWEDSNRDDRTIFAPGVRILSTWSEGRYARSNGTSFATPIVSAGAAMLLGSGMPVQEAVERLTATAIPVGTRPAPQPGQTAAPSPAPTASTPPTPPPVAPGQEVGLGRIDLAAAVQGVEPAPTPTSTPPPPPPVTEPAPLSDPQPGPGSADDSFGEVEVVEEVPAGPPTTPAAIVTAAPPEVQAGPVTPSAIPSRAPSTPDPLMADLEPVEVISEPTPPPTGLSVAEDASPPAGRGAAITVATVLVSANLAFAGVVFRGRKPGS